MALLSGRHSSSITLWSSTRSSSIPMALSSGRHSPSSTLWSSTSWGILNLDYSTNRSKPISSCHHLGSPLQNHFRALIIPWWKIEHDFELSSFGITAPNHFRALIIPWLKIQTDFERYLITDHRIYVNH